MTRQCRHGPNHVHLAPFLPCCCRVNAACCPNRPYWPTPLQTRSPSYAYENHAQNCWQLALRVLCARPAVSLRTCSSTAAPTIQSPHSRSRPSPPATVPLTRCQSQQCALCSSCFASSSFACCCLLTPLLLVRVVLVAATLVDGPWKLRVGAVLPIVEADAGRTSSGWRRRPSTPRLRVA